MNWSKFSLDSIFHLPTNLDVMAMSQAEQNCGTIDFTVYRLDVVELCLAYSDRDVDLRRTHTYDTRQHVASYEQRQP